MVVVDRKGGVQIGFNLLQLSRKFDRKGFNSYVMVGNNSILKLTCWVVMVQTHSYIYSV